MQANDSTYDKRAYPIARPTDCSKGAECKRFQAEFCAGAQAIDMGEIVTGAQAGGDTLFLALDDIVLGMYPGGGGANAPGGVLNGANTRKLNAMQKKAAGIMNKYFLDEDYRKSLRFARPASTPGTCGWRTCVIATRCPMSRHLLNGVL